MRAALVFVVLVLLKLVARVFYRVEMRWTGDPPADPWRGHRLVAILNHTSLFEPIFAAGAPSSFVWRIARHGIVPVARKTIERPLVGAFFRFIARHVVPISRHRDSTWSELLARIADPEGMVLILPEGRMKRPNGLDKDGKPMTVRGGIADILLAIPDGRMLLAYSGGLHHVQAPGEGLPRLFRRVRMNLEVVDIAAYRSRILEQAGEEGFREAVIADLTRRRDTYCPKDETAAVPA